MKNWLIEKLEKAINEEDKNDFIEKSKKVIRILNALLEKNNAIIKYFVDDEYKILSLAKKII